MAIKRFGESVIPQLLNSDGTVALSGRVDFLENVTSTPKNVFTDSDLAVSAGSSINLDAAGRLDVWMSGLYRVRFFDTNGVLQWEIDDVNLDILSAAPPGGTLNLQPNGSFELDSNGDGIADGWIETLFPAGVAVLDAVTVFHGAQSIKFTSGGTGGGTYTSEAFIEVQPGRDVVVSFAIQSSVVDVRNIVDIQWFKADKTAAATPLTNIYDDAATNPTSFANQISRTTPPSDARFLKLKLTGCDSSDVTPGDTFFDDIIVFQTVKEIIPPELLDSDVTQNEVVNTGVQTTIYSFVIKANKLPANGKLRITLLGDYLNNSGGGSALSFNVAFGAASLGFPYGSQSSGVNRRAILLNCDIAAKNATNAQILVGRAVLGGDVTEGTAATPIADIAGFRNNATVDTTADVTLEITVQHGAANAAISARIETIHVELLK